MKYLKNQDLIGFDLMINASLWWNETYSVELIVWVYLCIICFEMRNTLIREGTIFSGKKLYNLYYIDIFFL